MAGKKAVTWKPKKPYLRLLARSRRIEVRPYRETEHAAWREAHLGRRKLRNRFDGPKVKASELTRARYRRLLQTNRVDAKNGASFRFGIFDLVTGAVLGQISLLVINQRYRWANLGYLIHNQYWGNGYAAEAARLCIELGFGPLEFQRIEASIEPANKASAITAKRAGLRPEGRRRNFYIPDGFYNFVIFSENRLDYLKRRSLARH